MRIALTTALMAVLCTVAAPPALGAKDDVPDKNMYAVYAEAGRSFDIDARLLAAVHFTEQTYGPGARKGAYLGPFSLGDNAWGRYEDAYKKGKRPKRYPYQSGRLERCRDKHPCIHDLFDAAMATADFMQDNKADDSLDSSGTRKALCYFNTGVFDKKCDYEKRVIKKAEDYDRKKFRRR
jgi:hypothetical protein